MAKASPVNYLNNPFTLVLQQNAAVAIRNLPQKKGYIQGQNNFHLLTEQEKYVSRLFELHSRLVMLTDQLQHIRVFINRYPFRQYYLEQGISQLEYIQYHTEALYHKVHTILEVMRLLVNQVYELNIPIKDCTWLELCKRLNKKLPVMLSLESYFKTFKQIIDLRHISSHRALYEDDEKDEIDMRYGNALVKFEARGHNFGSDVLTDQHKMFVNWKLKEYKKKRVQLVDQVVDANNQLLDHFFNSLNTEFEQRHDQKRS